MLAILCSKLLATNSVMGKKIPKILPTMSLLAHAIHIARQTSQLQKTPRTSADVKVSPHLPSAILIAEAPTRLLSSAHNPERYIRYATASEPAKFAKYTQNQLRNNLVRVTSPSNTSRNIRTFPVNSSAPAMTTIIRPAENTMPLTSRPKPTPGMSWATNVAVSAPNAMNAPAKNPRVIILLMLRLALLHSISTALAATSFGDK